MRRIKHWLRKSYRDALIWILAIAMVGLISTVIYTYQAYRGAATNLLLRRDEQLVILASSRLQVELASFTHDLESIARRQATGDGGNPNSITQPGIGTQIFDSGLVRLNNQGHVVATLPERPDLIGQNWSSEDYFQAVLSNETSYISNYLTSGPSESPLIALSVPILDDSNHLDGVLVGFFQLGETNISALYANIIRLRIGQTGNSYIVDARGKIIYDSQNDRIGHSLTSNRLDLIRSAERSGVRLIDTPQSGKLVIAYAPIPGTTWTMVTEDDWNTLAHSFNRYSNILVLSFLAAMSLPPVMLFILRKQSIFPSLKAAANTEIIDTLPALRKELHPNHLPVLPGWKFLYRTLEGKRGGREFTDVRIKLDGRLVISLGEASEEGVHGSILITSVRSIFSFMTEQDKTPSDCLHACNEMLCSTNPDPVSVRGILLELNPQDGTYTFAQAEFPMMVQLGDQTQYVSNPTQQAMGSAIGVEYVTENGKIGRGEAILLISPSLLQRMNFVGQQFGEHILPSILDQAYRDPEDMFDEILEAARRFTKNISDHKSDAMLLLVYRTMSS